MADHSKPLTTSTYANFVTELDGRFDDLSVGLDPAVTTATNLITNSIRWSSASLKWQKWNGTTWNDLAASYSININGTVGATTPAAGAFTTLSSTGNTTLGDAAADTVTINGTIQPGVLVSGSSSTDMFRITQTGTGNAFVVEDSTNPDVSPFVIAASGNVGIGTTSPSYKFTVVGGATQLSGSTDAAAGLRIQSISGAATLTGINANNDTNFPIAFVTTAEAMRIDTSLNVGIGTTAPTVPLQIRKDQNATTAVLVQNRNASGTPVSALQFISGAFDLTDGRYAMISSDGGSATTLKFWTGNAVTPTERMRIDASGNVGIGTTSPDTLLNIQGVDPTLLIQDSDEAGDGFIKFQTANGTQRAFIQAAMTGNVMLLGTGTTERMRIDSSGNVLVTSAAGLGYGTGSGGTVTQATSKGTTVTLNKPTGQITMNNAALAAGTSVNFQLNNTLLAATDVLTCSPSQNGNYTAQTVYSGAASGAIRVTNITAGSLSEAVVINFAIIKGATS